MHEKEDLIAEKDTQIRLLTKNVNTLATELDACKFVKNTQNVFPYSSSLNKDYFIQKEGVGNAESANFDMGNSRYSMRASSPKAKGKEFGFFDKNIIKPIRGGKIIF